MPGQKLVVWCAGVEEAAVVTRHTQTGVALVNATEESQQAVVPAAGVGRVAYDQAAVYPFRELARHARQTLFPIGWIGDGQQAARLRVEHKKQLVEQAQAGLVNLSQALGGFRVDAKLLPAVGDEAAGDFGHHLVEDQLLELIADLTRVRGRTIHDALDERTALRVRHKGRPAEEEPEALERSDLAFFSSRASGGERGWRLKRGQHRSQVHFVELAGGAAGLATVEAPHAAVGQDAPRAAGAYQVADHLVARIAARFPGVAACGVLLAERPAPILGLGNGQGAAVERVVVTLVRIRIILGRVIGEEGIVGPVDAAVLGVLGLRDETPAQRGQQRLDELVLSLRLIPGRPQLLRFLPQDLHLRQDWPRVFHPFGLAGQAALQVVVRKKGFSHRRRKRQRLERHGVDPPRAVDVSNNVVSIHLRRLKSQLHSSTARFV